MCVQGGQKKEFLSEGFIMRWSEHVPCFIWDDEATGPGKLSTSTIPREYHHSSIEEEGQRGMMGGWGKEGEGGGGGKVMGGWKRGRDVYREGKERMCREVFPASFKSDNWSNLHTCLIECHFPETYSILAAALIFFSFHLTLTRKCLYTHWHCMLTCNRLYTHTQRNHTFDSCKQKKRKGTFCLLITAASHSVEDKEQVVVVSLCRIWAVLYLLWTHTTCV